MDRTKFLELQFQTLRKEIEETKSRIFTLELGLIGVPILPALVQIFLRPSNATEKTIWENLSGVLTAVMPFFIIILMMAFIAQRTGLMRCGAYIRWNIEPLIDGVTGWETWLENRPRQRRSDIFSFYGFLLICFFYYVLTSWVAVNYFAASGGKFGWLFTVIHQQYKPDIKAGELAAYVYILMGFIIFVSLGLTISWLTSTGRPMRESPSPQGRPQSYEPCEEANPGWC